MTKTVQSISGEMYYVFFTKVLQGGDTASGIVLLKRCSRTCGLNSRQIHLYTKSF